MEVRVWTRNIYNKLVSKRSCMWRDQHTSSMSSMGSMWYQRSDGQSMNNISSVSSLSSMSRTSWMSSITHTTRIARTTHDTQII